MFIKNNECSWIVRENSSQFFSRYYTDGCFEARFFTAKAEKLPNLLVHVWRMWKVCIHTNTVWFNGKYIWNTSADINTCRIFLQRRFANEPNESKSYGKQAAKKELERKKKLTQLATTPLLYQKSILFVRWLLVRCRFFTSMLLPYNKFSRSEQSESMNQRQCWEMVYR